MSAHRVVVVGGGLAGIAAALDCAGAGADVTLVEVRPQLGGAAYSFEREGLRVDNGQHVFLRCCTAYRRLLRRLGAEPATVLQPRLAIPVLAPGGRRGWLRRGALPAPAHLAPALLRYPFLNPRERAGVIGAALALARLDPDDPALDRRTFGSWLADHGQSPSAIEALWNLIALPTLNLHADEASLALAAFVFQTGLLGARDAGDIGYARLPLSAVHAEPAARALTAAGVDVRTRWRVQRVVRSDRGLGVEGPGERLDADAVVVAVPHDRAADLLPDGALPDHQALRRLGTSPIVNLHVVYDRRVLDLDFAAAVRSPVQYVFDRTRAAGLERGQYLAVSLSGAVREMASSPDELRRRYEPALAELLPAARTAAVGRFFVTREHAATFHAGPGVRALRPGPRTAIPGLVLAGAFTATGWPATMEGAVRSGHAAATEALAARRTPDGSTEKVAA
ncbi:MAG: hydroxysqualene dehydroxylase HpnE [Solirubrobacteraceae bacterium]